MKSMLLPVTNISRIRAGTDGHGIRTLVCAAPCPPRCRYCFDPHTRNMDHVRRFFVDELYETLRIDNLYFMATDGGVTFGGGEPDLFARFIHEFVRKYGGRWSINMETSLNFPRENLLLLLDAADYYFIDIKDMDPEIYKAYTGGDNSLVLENLNIYAN